MVLFRKILYAIILISLICSVADGEELTVDKLPFTIEKMNNSFAYSEKIYTFKGETIEVTFNEYFVSTANDIGINFDINLPGEITDSTREFYIDGEKQDFDEYLIIEQNNILKTIKQFSFPKGSHSIKIKIELKSDEFTYKIIENGTQYDFNYATRFHKGGDGHSARIFDRVTLRIPVVNSNNLKIDFQQSNLEDKNKNEHFMSNPKLTITDKYLDITYEMLMNAPQLIEKYPIIRVPPDEVYLFHTIFSVKYDTLRLDWIFQALIGAIILTLSFYGGRRWERNIKINQIRKKPPE